MTSNGTKLFKQAEADAAAERDRLKAIDGELLEKLVEIRKWMDADIMGPWDAKFCAEIDALVARAAISRATTE